MMNEELNEFGNRINIFLGDVWDGLVDPKDSIEDFAIDFYLEEQYGE